MKKLKAMFNGLWCYRYLLWNLVSRDFKLKYRRSVLGVVWSVLNPLLMCLVYWLSLIHISEPTRLRRICGAAASTISRSS